MTKRREFIKYSETETGKKLRKIHERINDALRKNYVSSEKSYAYKKGSSIKKCVELHQNNNGFIKYKRQKIIYRNIWMSNECG